MAQLSKSEIEQLVMQHDQLVDEIQQLVSDLENARAVFVGKDPDDAHDGYRRRQGAVSALAAVINYLDAVGVQDELYVPLNELWGALVDAESGLSNPLTAPSTHRHKGGTKTKHTYALDMAKAAAAVTLKCHSGEKLSDALAEVARKAGVGEKQLENFRKQVSSRRGNNAAKDLYHLMLKELAAHDLPREEQARLALEAVPKIM